MKKSIAIFLWFGLGLLACQHKENPTLGEACSVKLGEVAFTKSLNGAQKLITWDSGKIIMKSAAKTDYFNEPDGSKKYGNAPILLTKIDNQKPFTFTVKLSPTWHDTYDAGTLYIFQDQDHWFKFAFEQDERQLHRMVTVKTHETSDDNNHDVVANASVYMKISSDTKTIGFYYSTDKLNWQLVRLFKNEYPAENWIGISSQSPIGKGNQTVFEDCSLSQSSIKDFRLGI